MSGRSSVEKPHVEHEPRRSRRRRSHHCGPGHFFGLDGVWWGYCLSFTALLVFQATYYFGWWRKKEITALV